MIYDYIMYAIYGFATAATVVNLFLCYIASRYSSRIGSFKYFVLAFAILECLFSVVVLLTVPMFYVYDYRMTIFSYNSLLSKSSLASFAAGLYCTFYELWLGFIVIMFVDRYIVLCRDHWRDAISRSKKAKLVLLILYFCHVTYSLVCGTIWCVNDRIPESVEEKIREEFEMNGTHILGYMVVTLKHKDNTFSYDGLIAFFNHFFLLISSTIIVISCSRANWKQINLLTVNCSSADTLRDKQIFCTMIMQGIIPFITYQVPSVPVLVYALFFKESPFGAITPLMSLLTTIPKLIDPLLALFIIKEYRVAVQQIFRGIMRGPKVHSDLSLTNTVNVLDTM